ncbi:MAG: hypothetical protein HN356_06070 [Calditrichaeota bacterium]|nr:hypothetical protein [Calditrichota bacterium]MBT6500928.1 hypothetical protein [Deltaproteobacteria bacterium]MBT7618300.1 hypothetical protein [Calditrichota bacterium]
MNDYIFMFFPYITLLVFVLGVVIRIRAWAKSPQPGKMTLFPATQGTEVPGVIKEALFFPSLFKGDKTLWSFSWIFHATLALIFIGHIRVFTDFPALWAALNINADNMSATSGGIAGILVMATLILLLFRRFFVGRVREISNLADYFALVLVLAVIITGNMMRFSGHHFDLELTRAYFSSMLTFSFSAMVVPADTIFRAHFLLVQLLFVYIPFSKILHFGGIFFTQTLVKQS